MNYNIMKMKLTPKVSFFIINKLINHTAVMESRHFVIAFIFVVIRFT